MKFLIHIDDSKKTVDFIDSTVIPYPGVFFSTDIRTYVVASVELAIDTERNVCGGYLRCAVRE